MTVGPVKTAYEKLITRSKYQRVRFIEIKAIPGNLFSTHISQSISDSGNSQGIAPMESFYGQMKTETMDNIAPSPTFKVSIDIEAFFFRKNNVPFDTLFIL